MAESDVVAKRLGALLNGIAQNVFYKKSEVTAELLRDELFPELPPGEFMALHDKMKGLLKSMASADMEQDQLEAFLTAQSRKQGGAGGVTVEQTAALSRFWRSQRARVRENLLAQNRWEAGLRGVSWRVDLQAATCRSGRGDAHSGPMALLELELGRTGQDSQFVCVELDEAKVEQVLKKMADIQESVDRIVQQT